MRRLLDERQWRVYLGTEALALGYGGIAAVARASGAAQSTVAAGAAEAESGDEAGALPRGRSRRAGGGRKKEELGPFAREGRAWRPAGDPVKVRDHDFPDRDRGKIIPYGVYDIAANRGFVSVGTGHDTAAFAVSALRAWWRAEGSLRYPAAARLLVTCDAGGSNSCGCRLWKDQLAVLAAETGLVIMVCHFPPGTSKWNKIEHRLFCHITRTWRARPLM